MDHEDPNFVPHSLYQGCISNVYKLIDDRYELQVGRPYCMPEQQQSDRLAPHLPELGDDV